MNDIFGFQTKVGKGFIESEQGIIIGGGGKLELVQDWNVQYQLQVTPVYECGTSTVYFAAKHGSGTLTCNRIVASSFSDIKSSLGEICNPTSPIIEAYTGSCGGTTAVKATMTGSILVGVAFSGNSQQAYVGEQLTANFVGLSES